MSIYVDSETPRKQYTVTGGTTEFTFDFNFFQDSDIAVYVDSTKKTLTTHYSVTGEGNNTASSHGGTVTFDSAVSNCTVTIVREIAIQRITDFPASGSFQVDSLNTELDTITAVQQELEDDISRTVRLDEEDASATMTLPLKASRASKTLGFDTDGNVTVISDFLPAGGDSAQFTYSTTTTDSDPSSGYIRFNNTTIASVTAAYVDDEEANGTDVSAWVQSFDDVTGNATNRGRIRVSKANTLDTWAVFKITAAVNDASGYTKLTLVHIDSAGTFANNDKVFLSFTASGEDGAINGYYYKFDTGTSDTDPGSGEIAFNNGTYASVTAIYIDDADANGVTTQTDTITWDDSTSTIKGFLHIIDINDSTTYARFKITGSSTDASGYNKLAVTHLASNNTFSSGDELSVHFTRTGDKGDTGSTGSTGASGVAGLAMTWSSSTSDADAGAGKIAFNNGTVSSVSILYVDDADDAGVDISGFVQSWDDVSNSTARGYVTVTKEGTPSTYATFKVSGAVTDASGYTKVPVTHVVSNGSFSNTDGVGVQFVQSGADGTGDITGVTAGTGLSGGGTSGGVTLNVDASQAVTALTGGDLTIYEDANNADVSLKMGTSATESLTIQVLNGGSNKTAEEVHFSTATASGTANHGKMVFDIDGTDKMLIEDNGVWCVGNTHTASVSGSTSPTMAQYVNFIWTLTGALTLTDPTDETIGQSGIFVFIQDGTGSRTLSHADDRYHVAGGTSITLSTAANAVDIVPYFVQADGTIHLGAAQKAFSEA